jgi:hypothetical protein
MKSKMMDYRADFPEVLSLPGQPASSEAQGLLEPNHLTGMSSDLLAIIRIAWLERASKDLSRGKLGV